MTSPTYILDLEDSFSRAVLESAKPGKAFTVRVRQVGDRSAPSINAIGRLDDDGKIFRVEVNTGGGLQTFEEDWSDLRTRLATYRE